MIPKEIFRKIRRIEILTNRLVNEMFAGQYHSVFKGRGMEFAEVREYIPGDDVRSIDWNVSARFGHLFVKQFTEERELTVVLLVDGSGSTDFGTTRQTKREVTAEVGAILAFSAIKNNDRIGLIIFTDKVEKFVPPKKGTQHVLRIIREILTFTPSSKGTNLSSALEYLHRVITRRCVAFVLSDFLASPYEQALKLANQKHDIIAVTISDPREKQLPAVGFLRLKDAETGETFLIDTGDPDSLLSFERLSDEQATERSQLFRRLSVDEVIIDTDKPYLPPLVNLFRTRARRIAH